MIKTINMLIHIIFLLLFVLPISNGEPMKKLLVKHRKLEVSATLNFIKAYDLIFEDNKWKFKISTDTEMPNESNVLVDIFIVQNIDTIQRKTAYCIYNKKILSCENNYYPNNNDLIKLAVIKYQGTIEWENLRVSEIKIPLNTTMSYIKSYGLFFANKWNFMIDAKTITPVPNYSKAIIDIVHNSVETTATCEILGNFANYITNISCVSDYENQSENDIIKLNSNKKYGSIQWKSKLTSSQRKIETIEDYSEISLQFIDAYDLYYDNNKWVFTIQSASNDYINPGKKYLIDINYKTSKKEQDYYASCLLKEGMKKKKNILLICACEYKNQDANDLIQIKYPKTETSTITWTTGISENYKITLKTSLTLVKAYNLTLSNVWSFNVDVTEGILPTNSKIRLDIFGGSALSTVNCTSLSNNNIFCLTDLKHSSMSVSLSKEKSTKGSVDWKKNLQDDYRIYLHKELAYRGGQEISFNDTDNKWYFTIKVVLEIQNSKIKIDILYGEKSSTATCICYGGAEYSCVVDEPVQDKKTLIKMNRITTESSSVTWNDLDNNAYSDNFRLVTDLTLLKTGYIYSNPNGDKTWIIDLDVEDENIPENSIIIIDIAYIRTTTPMYNYVDTDKRYSTAKCTYTFRKLICEADSALKGHEYSIFLQLEKVVGSKSSLRSWKNANDFGKISLPLLLKATLNYHYCTNVKLIEDKYIFKCRFHESTPIPRYSDSIIDILSEDRLSTSYCTGIDFFNIKCELKQEDYKDQNNYVSAQKTRKSTITWNGININQYLFPIELEFFEAYNSQGGRLLPEYPFNMLAKGDKLKDGIKFDIIAKNIRYDKCPIDNMEIEEEVPCEVYGGICYCWWYSPQSKVDLECDSYYLLLRSEGDDIKWTNPGNYYFMENYWLTMIYKNLISINYNQENERYEFSLNIQKTIDFKQYKIILDIYIEKQLQYALCQSNVDDNSIINCFTDKIKYKKATIIELSKSHIGGNVIWSSLSENKILQGGEIYYIMSDKIYDLKYDVNQWKFIIKASNIMPFEGTKQLDILINDQPGLANCNINSDNDVNLLICAVDSSQQTNADLIRLYDNKDSELAIQIIDMKNDGIPLNINLEFIQAYDLNFDYEIENWFFRIKAKIFDNNIVIPEGSTFSTGFLYEYNNIISDDIVFCTKEGNIENDIINLLCRPEYKKIRLC